MGGPSASRSAGRGRPLPPLTGASTGTKGPPAESPLEVTAGEVVARVESEHGLIEVPFDVARDATADFDPLEHRPTSLTIVGVPAGSQVELYVEAPSGVEVRHSLDVAPDEGTIDDETGILLAPPQRVFSLRGGQGSLPGGGGPAHADGAVGVRADRR